MQVVMMQSESTRRMVKATQGLYLPGDLGRNRLRVNQQIDHSQAQLAVAWLRN